MPAGTTAPTLPATHMKTTGIAFAFALLAAASARAQSADPREDRLARLESQVQALTEALGRVQHDRAEQDRVIQDLRAELGHARAAGDVSEARLKELEQKLAATDGAEIERLVRQEADALPWRRFGARGGAITWGGYFDLEFREDKAGDSDATFDQHRLILQFHSDIAEWITFDSEIEIEGGGVGPGYLTDSAVVVEYAELRFHLAEEFNFRAGGLLVPFNRFNLLHDSPLQDLTDRPLVDRRIIPTTWTEAGIGASGAFHTDPVSIDYDIVVVNGLTDAISATNGMRNARGSFRADNNDSKMVIGRIGVTPAVPWFDALNAGFSLGHGHYDDEDRRNLTMFGFDATVKKRPFELVGEYAKANLSREDEEILAGIPGGMEGWYVEARFHFFPESWRGTARFFNDQSTFTLVTRWDDVDTDTGAKAVDFAARGDRYRDDRRRFTLGFNFRPIEKTVFKVEYQWFFEPSGIEDVDNNRFVASFATYF